MTTLSSKLWGHTTDGQPVHLYTLGHPGLVVELSTYGAGLISVQVPDAEGALGHILLGADTLEPYLMDPGPYLGASIGRVANRIAKGGFTLDGKQYQVPLNNGPNALHGGPAGFDRKVWQALEIPDGVRFTCTSPDGEMGFPGTVTVHAEYTLGDSSLRIVYTATTDAPTHVNLTNHAYWNLSGRAEEIGSHLVQLNASHYTPVDETLIPTGELAPVAGTPFDLRRPTTIAPGWDAADPQMQRAGGFDHNWVIDPSGTALELPWQPAATVHEARSGRALTLHTTQPGVQFYSGNFLDGSFAGRSGPLAHRTGFCLEPQHFPDSCNHPEFPSTRLDPGETYGQTILFTFGLVGGS